MDTTATHQYGEQGFIPTVEAHSTDKHTDDLILHTIDDRRETDIVLRYGEVPTLFSELCTEEQQDVMRLINRE